MRVCDSSSTSVMCLETALKIGKLAAWESARRDTMSAAVATTKNINSTTLRLSSLSELLHSPATELLACCDSTGNHESAEGLTTPSVRDAAGYEYGKFYGFTFC